MGQAIAVRTDYTAGEVRRLATRAKDAAQARRLLAIAAVLEGASREDAAEIAGMDRQTLRDWVIQFNERGPDGLINIPYPGVPPKLDTTHKAFLARIVEEGPNPGSPRRGALAGLRSDDANCARISIFGVGRHDLSRAEGSGLLACECQTEGLQAGCRSHGRVQKNFAERVADIRAQLAPGTPVEVVPGRDAGRPEGRNSPIAGPERAHVPAPATINAPNRPICSARYARNAEPVPHSCCPPATPRPCSFISTRSPPRSPPAPTPFSSSIKPDGMARKT